MGFRSAIKKYATLKVPGFAAQSSSRVTMDVSIMPIHESLNEEILNDPELHTVLRESVMNRSLPTSYFQHPHVESASEGQWPFPLALCFDAMPYIKRDGVLAVVVLNILSGVRHLVGVLRKSTFCRCGCRGWCSIWPFLANLHWSLSALREGFFSELGVTKHALGTRVGTCDSGRRPSRVDGVRVTD